MDQFGDNPIVVGLDPGRRSTGIVIVLVEPVLGVILAKRLRNWRVCDLLWGASHLEVVGIEDFQLRPSAMSSLKWNTLREVRLIGAVEEVCRRRGIPLTHVTPAQAKKLVTDERLIALGTWSRNVHVADAFRVLWVVLFERGSNQRE